MLRPNASHAGLKYQLSFPVARKWDQNTSDEYVFEQLHLATWKYYLSNDRLKTDFRFIQYESEKYLNDRETVKNPNKRRFLRSIVSKIITMYINLNESSKCPTIGISKSKTDHLLLTQGGGIREISLLLAILCSNIRADLNWLRGPWIVKFWVDIANPTAF